MCCHSANIARHGRYCPPRTLSTRMLNPRLLSLLASYSVATTFRSVLPLGQNMYFHSAADDTVVQLSDAFRWGRLNK
jgi:hypothetical protein